MLSLLTQSSIAMGLYNRAKHIRSMIKSLKRLFFVLLVSCFSIGMQSCKKDDIKPVETSLLEDDSNTQDDDEPTEEEIP